MQIIFIDRKERNLLKIIIYISLIFSDVIGKPFLAINEKN